MKEMTCSKERLLKTQKKLPVCSVARLTRVQYSCDGLQYQWSGLTLLSFPVCKTGQTPRWIDSGRHLELVALENGVPAPPTRRVVGPLDRG